MWSSCFSRDVLVVKRSSSSLNLFLGRPRSSTPSARARRPGVRPRSSRGSSSAGRCCPSRTRARTSSEAEHNATGGGAALHGRCQGSCQSRAGIRPSHFSSHVSSQHGSMFVMLRTRTALAILASCTRASTQHTRAPFHAHLFLEVATLLVDQWGRMHCIEHSSMKKAMEKTALRRTKTFWYHDSNLRARHVGHWPAGPSAFGHAATFPRSFCPDALVLHPTERSLMIRHP